MLKAHTLFSVTLGCASRSRAPSTATACAQRGLLLARGAASAAARGVAPLESSLSDAASVLSCPSRAAGGLPTALARTALL